MASKYIEGFPLTNEIYTQALKLLKEHYPQLIVSSHMNAVIKLEMVNGENVKSLCQLYDKIESSVRPSIPVVLEKLPNVIRLQVSRTLGTNWDVKEF